MATSFDDLSIPSLARKVRLAELTITAREFLRRPVAVGSAFPASRFMVDAMLEPVDWSRISTMVEFGPGGGVFTRALLARLSPDARLIAIDTGAAFVDHLASHLPDPRLHTVVGCAADVAPILTSLGVDRVDAIVSGLPFSTLSPGKANAIMAASRSVLAPSGLFMAYQMRRHVHALLNRHFARVRTGFAWRNMPPCHLYWADDRARGRGNASTSG